MMDLLAWKAKLPLKTIKWVAILVLFLGSNVFSYYKGRESLTKGALKAQIKQSEKDNVNNVERAERVVTAKAERDVRVENKLKELQNAIEEARALRDAGTCQLTDDELRVLNELFEEANSGLPKGR